MLIAYILSLCFAAAFVGSFVRGVFAQFGYIPGLTSAVYVTLGAALVYAGKQLLYFALLRIYQPTRTRVVYATETCSNLAAILLLPALLNIPIPGMTGRLERVVPLVYCAVFIAVHFFFKLASFYAALTGPEDHGRTIYRWGLSGFASALIGVMLFLGWRGAVDEARVAVTGSEARVAAGTQYGYARVIPEGASYSGSISANDSPTIALRFAPVPAEENRPAVDRVYVTVSMQGRDTKVYQDSVALHASGWSEITIPGEYIPRDVSEYSLYWTRVGEPNWQRILGIRPIVYNLPETPGDEPPLPAQVYMSGPSVYASRPAAKAPNLLVVLIDGLGTDHVSLFGYPREVTPAIDRVGYRAQLYPNTIASGANINVALSAILTGEDPAQLGESAPGTALPELLRRAGYATVAFIETGENEVIGGAAWADGFEIFDRVDRSAATEDEPVPGAIARARAWIVDHQFIPFLCVVRVRTLAAFPPDAVEAPGEFTTNGEELDVDRFDNALLDVDRRLGALFKFVRDYETRSNTCIVVTAPYGHVFSPGASRKFQGVPSEKVPLIIEIPDRRQRKVPKEAHLHDLGATLAYLANVRLPSTADGVNLVP